MQSLDKNKLDTAFDNTKSVSCGSDSMVHQKGYVC